MLILVKTSNNKHSKDDSFNLNDALLVFEMFAFKYKYIGTQNP